MKLARLSPLFIALLVTSAHAVSLPPMNPVVSSSVWGGTWKEYNVQLFAEGDSFNGSKNNDYASFSTNQKGGWVNLGGANFGRDFNQFDASKVFLGATAMSNFKVNKVGAQMIGAAPTPTHSEYGSMAASQGYWDSYIGNNYWGWNGGTPSYDSVWDSSYNSGAGRYIYVPTGTPYEYDQNGALRFGSYDNSGNWVADTRVVASYGGTPDYWNNYLVPAQMPEIAIDSRGTRYVTARSQWENIFYFGGNGQSQNGTATFHLKLTGDIGSGGNYAGSFHYAASDWEHKDVYSGNLKDISIDTQGNLLIRHLSGQSWVTDYQGIYDPLAGVEFDVSIGFTYGTPQYIKSLASADLSGEGVLDFAHSVEILGVEVPENTAVYSYAGYLTGEGLGFGVTGGVDGNSLPGGSGAYFGSGGGNPPPVPEPETYAMMLAGIAMVGWAARRRRVG